MISVFEKRLALKEDRPVRGESPFKQRARQVEEEKIENEPWYKSLARYVAQIPLGIAQATPPGIAANFLQLLGSGEVSDPEDIERIRQASEKMGIPFDEEKYREAAEKALGHLPTPSNIARIAEETTGLPLTPQTTGQKLLQLSMSAAKFQPGATSQKAVAGVTAPAVAGGLGAAGVPEPVADIAGLGAALGAGKITPQVEIELAKTKPSGMKERQFESLKKTTEVPEKKLAQINEKLEKDFKSISDKIIKESPIGETAENLRNDPTFKQESRELLDQAQEIANQITKPIDSVLMKKELADMAAKKTKGFALSEYDKSYLKFIKENIKGIVPKKISAGELVEQYRKNNASLSEYFEPGASRALNRAKKDALLDANRSIANVMEKSFPESDLVPVFKEGNARWTKIMDAEAIDEFVSDMFSGEKINYKKMHDLFNKEGYSRIFKRGLGEKGYLKFEQLMKDMLTSEAPYKMLKVAKSKGFDDLFKAGMGYIIHPNIGKTKAILDSLKYSYNGLLNAMLDKPKLGLTFRKAVDDLKKGDFKSAEQEFKIVNAEVLPKEVKTKMADAKTESIEGKAKRIEKPLSRVSGNQEQTRLGEPKKQVELKPEQIQKPKPKNKPKKYKTTKLDEKLPQIKRQDVSKKGLKEQKKFLITELDKAIEKAPQVNLPIKPKNGRLFEQYKKAHESFKEVVEFDVPGDGVFKIKNHKKALETFKKSVEKKWPDKPLKISKKNLK
jgi:hypothetical protein